MKETMKQLVSGVKLSKKKKSYFHQLKKQIHWQLFTLQLNVLFTFSFFFSFRHLMNPAAIASILSF